MFCRKCGTKNDDNAKFCVNCGERFISSQPVNREPVMQANPSGSVKVRNRKVGKQAVVIVAILVVVAAFLLLGGRSYKKTANQFIDALFYADANTIVNLLPDKVVNYMVRERFDSRREMIEELEEELNYDFVDSMKWSYGDNWKYSYKIVNVEDLSPKELKSLKGEYKEMGIKVSDAKIVNMKVTISTKDDEDSEIIDVGVIKVGRSWYIDIINTDF